MTEVEEGKGEWGVGGAVLQILLSLTCLFCCSCHYSWSGSGVNLGDGYTCVFKAIKHFIQMSSLESRLGITFHRWELFPGIFKCFLVWLRCVGVEKRNTTQRKSLKTYVKMLLKYPSVLSLIHWHNVLYEVVLCNVSIITTLSSVDFFHLLCIWII